MINLKSMKKMSNSNEEICINISEIKKAFANDEFYIYYQPKVDNKNKIVGVEALSRWFNYKHGDVPPNIFISIIEESDFLYEFQLKLVENAIKDISYLNEILNYKINLSINISPKQLEKDEFVRDTKVLIDKLNVDAELIEFEITEDYSILEIENIYEKLKQLRKIGIKISLDDFGKGNNSIKYLTKFDFDIVKIDKEYINIVEQNPKFIKSIIMMIHSVGSVAISEGVETKAQADLLYKLGCDINQGYYYYKPVTYNKLQDILLESQSEYLK